MPSPFPGMDPFLEPHWLDVHTKLVAYAADALNHSLPPKYVARTEERVGIEVESDDGSTSASFVRPDVSVTTKTSGNGGGVLLDAPFVVEVAEEPITQRSVRILDSQSGQLVTVLEFLSPGNKSGVGMQEYKRKRRELLEGGVNVAEVDLIVAGDWRELLRPYACPVAAVSRYRAIVWTPSPKRGHLFPIQLADALPEIPIPLRGDEQPIKLALQPLLNAAYDNGRYAQSIDYGKTALPPLSAGELTWMRETVAVR